jgi:hypothetical protein
MSHQDWLWLQVPALIFAPVLILAIAVLITVG